MNFKKLEKQTKKTQIKNSPKGFQTGSYKNFLLQHNLKKYDYIIAGMGCTGLSLAYQLTKHPKLRQKKVLLIDRDEKNKNDRTWCFWEKETGIFEKIVCKKWSKLHFKSPKYEAISDIAPFAYKMIRGIDYYNFILPVLEANPNFEFVFADIQSIENNETHAALKTDENTYHADYIFNSALRPKIDFNSCNYVAQHFKGWEIETPTDTFDDTVATFMDFDINQKGEARFFYVLPTSKRKALVEIAIFSNNVLADEEYEKLVDNYIHNQLKINQFKVLHKEFGVIPMTDYDFGKHQNERIIQLGTSGGQVKPSTGYAFSRIQKNIAKIFANLANGKHPATNIQGKARFRFYDRIFLNVIVKNRVTAPNLFAALFEGNPTTRLLRFLGEESHLGEELLLVNSPPKLPFIKGMLDEYF